MKRFLSAFLCILFLFSLVACNRAEPKPATLFEEVVNKTETGYAFAGMDWSVTKAQAMEQLNVTPDTVERDMEDRFTIAVHSDQLKADGHATYVFIDKDNQLCTGRYYFPISGSDHAGLRSRLKEMALEWLGKPDDGWGAFEDS